MKIGAITVGQSPRVDVTADIMGIFGENVEILQAGALDGLSSSDIAKFAPQKDDYVLVSRLVDGTSVTFAERCILPILQEKIDWLESEKCEIIMVFCTGKFPNELDTKKVPLIYPCDILDKIIPLLTKKSSIVCVTPSDLQLKQCEQKWKNYVKNVKAVNLNPYDNAEMVEYLAHEIANINADLVVLDCIGYTAEMKNIISKITGKKVVLPRTLLARVVSEITDI